MLEQPGLHSKAYIHTHTKMQITSAARSELDGHNRACKSVVFMQSWALKICVEFVY